MKRLFTTGIAAATLLLSCLSGCTKTEETFHYVNLSQVACSFLGEGNQPLEITVKASPAAYEATPGATWVKATQSEDGKALILTVDDNNTGTERNTVIVVTAGQASQEIVVYQLPQDNPCARFRTIDSFRERGAMSPSGKYIGGFIPSIGSDGEWQYEPTIMNIETGETYRFGPFSESLYYMTQTMAVTDQGLLFIKDGMNGGMIAIDIEGNITHPEAPETFYGKPTIQGTSADGRYWVGYAKEAPGKDGLYKPLLWIDGIPHELPLPDLSFRDEKLSNGVLARGISADGRIIYGSSWDGADFGMLYWNNEEENTDKPKWAGTDVRKVWKTTLKEYDGTEYEKNLANGLICQAELTKISPSGKWLASAYREEIVEEDQKTVTRPQVAAFYNTETETTVIVDDYGDGTVGTHVTDDGIGFITVGTSSMVYDLNTQTPLGSIQEWVYDQYGIIIPAERVLYITQDGKYMFGFLSKATGVSTLTISWYIAPPLEK